MPEQRILCRQVLLETGWASEQILAVDEGGLIHSVKDNHGAPPDVVLDGPVIPGMPNLHSHAFQRLIAGLTSETRQGADNFWGWRQTMYGFAQKITPDQIEACATWLYAEMLSAGYTSCGEFHYLHHQPGGKHYAKRSETSERILAAADRSGISLTLLPVFYHASGFGKKSVEAHQRRFANSLDDYLALLEEVHARVRHSPVHRAGIAPHSLRAVPAPLLLELLAACDQDLPVHIHVAEQVAEVEDSLEYLSARPVQWLLDNAGVDPRWCLVHATHMDAAEAKRAACSGAVAGLCPSTEADLGDGYFNTSRWLEEGGSLGIGSDSNLIISPAEELRLLEFGERIRTRRRNILRTETQACGQFLWTHAARNGARAIAQPVGRIARSCRADFVELDPEHPMLVARGVDSILETLVFAGLSGMVRSVFVAGNQLVADGRHVEHDSLARRFSRAARALVEQ